MDNLQQISYWIMEIEQIVLFSSCVILLYSFRRLPQAFKVFTFYLLLELIIEVSAHILAANKIRNLPLLHILTLGEFVLLSLFFRILLKEVAFFQKYFNHFFITGIVFIIANSLFFENIFIYNSISKSGVQIAIISYAVIYFYQLTNHVNLQDQLHKSLRLINAAIIIYYSASLFVFLFGQIINAKGSKFFHLGIPIFHTSIYLIFQIIILIAIIKYVFRRTLS